MGRHEEEKNPNRRFRTVVFAGVGVVAGGVAMLAVSALGASGTGGNTANANCTFAIVNGSADGQVMHCTAPTTAPPTTAPPSTTPAPTKTPPPTTPPPTKTTTPPPTTGWPSASNTGIPAGTKLANAGSIVAATPGQVIDAKNITGTITVRAANVVIKNSRINAGTAYWGIEIDSGSATIEDSEITGSAAGAVWGENYTLLRNNIHDFHGDGMKLGDNDTVQDNWIHDATTQGGQHCDGMQLEVGASNVVIRHNNVDPDEDGSNSAVFIKNDLGPNNTVGPVIIDDNLLGGGGFTLYVYKGSSGLKQGGVHVTDNRFLQDGFYGPVATNYTPAEWSGNVYDNNGANITP